MRTGNKQQAILAVAAVLLWSTASAETVTWNTLSSNATDDVDNGNPMTFNSNVAEYGGVNLTGFRIGQGQYGAPGVIEHRAADGSRIAQAMSYSYGVGVDATGDGSHTIDGSGYYDAVLLDFGAGSDISLDAICMWTGWAGNVDTDFSLYAYAGSGTFDLSDITHSASGYDQATLEMPNFDASNWTLSDWTKVASVDWDLNAGTRPNNQIIAATNGNLEAHMIKDLNPGDVESRYWIVAAIDSASPFSNFKLEFVRDEIASIDPVPPTGVPAPGTLVLMLPMIGWLRKQGYV